MLKKKKKKKIHKPDSSTIIKSVSKASKRADDTRAVRARRFIHFLRKLFRSEI